ncbi:MAG: tetratricopeptide repeat protein [Lachnospiraceae bacterium]
MNCMNCKAPLTESDYCPRCGWNVLIQKKAIYLSGLYYNQGYEKASIRDLSGAITCLKQSLRLNKMNMQARNLLGLVYFEVGEVVAALSEWVISKNMHPNNNIAEEYIERLRSNAAKLDVINQSIHKYNHALENSKEGHEDMALVQLKRVLTQNPKLIKGYHLYALLQMKEGKYAKARRALKKAARIDKTNTTTLRFLREVEEQTGVATKLERMDKGEKWEASIFTASTSYVSGNDLVIVPPAYRERSMVGTVVNIAIGFAVGACVLWFLIVPAHTRRTNSEANAKIVEYSDTMAMQSTELTQLQKQITDSAETVNTAQEQVTAAEDKSNSLEALLKAYDAYAQGDTAQAGELLATVNQDLLTIDSQVMYTTISQAVAAGTTTATDPAATAGATPTTEPTPTETTAAEE